MVLGGGALSGRNASITETLTTVIPVSDPLHDVVRNS